MRHLVLPLLALAALLAAFRPYVARADGEAPTNAVLAAQVKALQAQVEYLRSRDVTLTKATAALSAAGGELQATAADARAAGFEAAAIPPASRVALLSGLDKAAKALYAAAPALTPSEVLLKKKAEAAKGD